MITQLNAEIPILKIWYGQQKVLFENNELKPNATKKKIDIIPKKNCLTNNNMSIFIITDASTHFVSYFHSLYTFPQYIPTDYPKSAYTAYPLHSANALTSKTLPLPMQN